MESAPIVMAKFALFHVILTSADVLTDSSTFVDLLQQGHLYWFIYFHYITLISIAIIYRAALTLAWMFLPVFTKIFVLLLRWIVACWKGEDFPVWAELKKTLYYFPLVSPLRNTWNIYQPNKDIKRESNCILSVNS